MLKIVSSAIKFSSQGDQDDLIRQIDDLKSELKDAIEREDRRTLQLADWLDEDRRELNRFIDYIHHIHPINQVSNRRAMINNIK